MISLRCIDLSTRVLKLHDVHVSHISTRSPVLAFISPRMTVSPNMHMSPVHFQHLPSLGDCQEAHLDEHIH